MKRTLFLLIALLATSCATFGIHNLNFQDGREGKDYTLSSRAWDDDAGNVQVTFVYRINGGAWKEKQGDFNGSVFEAVISGNEMVAGRLEYYAYMINAKGKKVSSSAATVSILSYAQAKNKAVSEYLSRLSDGNDGSLKEIYYNETLSLKLRSVGSPPASAVSCTVSSISGTQKFSSKNTLGGIYEIIVPPIHNGSTISYQWNVLWNDPEFGELAVNYPSTPAIIKIIDQAALKAKLEKEMVAALSHAGPVSGNFFEPANVTASLKYSALLNKYSKAQKQVNLVLKRYGYSKAIPMYESSSGIFTTQVPVADMEQGWLTYSIQYSDVFSDIGTVLAEYPAGSNLNIVYKSYETMKAEAVEKIRLSFTHNPPTDGVEGHPLNMVVGLSDKSLKVISIDLELTAIFAMSKASSFMFNGSDYRLTIPGNWIRAGEMKYRIHATVRDAKFGDIKVILPLDTGFYSAKMLSLAEALAQEANQLLQLRKQKEADLNNSLKHYQPENIYWGKDFTLSLIQSPMLTGSLATIYYRNNNFGNYASIVGSNQGGTWIFSFNRKVSENPSFNYYFSVTVNDVQVGPYTAVCKQNNGGDFSLSPIQETSSDLPVVTPLPPEAPDLDAANIAKIRENLRTSLYHTPDSQATKYVPLEVAVAVNKAPSDLTIQFWYTATGANASGNMQMTKTSNGYTAIIPIPAMAGTSVSYAFELSTKYTMKNGMVQTITERFPSGKNNYYTVPIVEPVIEPVGSYYTGNRDDWSGVDFFVKEDKSLGLYDVSVMLKVQNFDSSYREFKMDRKGKTFTYHFDTKTIPIGTRIDFYYVIYKKGAPEQKITDANSIPFYTVIHQVK